MQSLRPQSIDGPSPVALRDEFRRLGLLEPRPGWYTASIVVHIGLVVLLYGVFVWTKSLWVAPILGFAYYQLGLLYHDLSHFQGYPNRTHNDIAALLVAFLIGGSLSRWRHDHNRHHGHTNDLDNDPDLEGPLSHTPEQAASRRGFPRLLTRTQHIWILPLSCVVLMPIIRVKDIVFVATRKYPRRLLEIAILLAHYIAYATLVFSVLSGWQAVAFIVVHQTVFGSLFSLAFVVNHFGMTVRTGRPENRVTAQIVSTRNVRPSVVWDYLLGPLGPHIEHHTFPTMPRCSLREAAPHMKRFAEEAGVQYRELSAWGVQVDTVSSLRALAAHASGTGASEPAK